jgi:hypothetical protein
VVPKEDIRAIGTADPIHDALEQDGSISQKCTVRTVH